MSAHHASADGTPWRDDRDRDCDPHDIVPEGFVAAWGGDSIPHALAIAERAPSSSHDASQPCCPECASLKIRTKTATVAQSNQRPEDHRCEACGAHFDEPADSPLAVGPGEQSELTRWSE